MNKQKHRLGLRIVQTFISRGIFIILCCLCSQIGIAQVSKNPSYLFSEITPKHIQTQTLAKPSTYNDFFVTLTPTATTESAQTSSDYSNTLQLWYVILTGILVLVSVISIFVSRKLSKDALNESKDEAKQTKYDQNKPIIMCNTIRPQAGDISDITLELENVGSGVATNVWSVLSFVNRAVPVHSDHLSILAPSKPLDVHFTVGVFKLISTDIEGYSFLPEQDENNSYSARLITTYCDVFNHKHLSISDFSNEYGWRQFALKSNITRTLEEISVPTNRIKKSKTPQEKFYGSGNVFDP